MVTSRTVRPLPDGISLAFVFFAVPLLLLVAGCGSTAGTAPVPPPTVTISAQPASITAGQSSTLTIVAANAQTVTVTGSDGTTYTMPSAGGTGQVSPTSTTTYTATAVGASGKATATATVTVGAAAQPTVTVTASPGTIDAGSSSTLTVTATNATSVTISGSDGSSYSLQSSGGTQSVKPSATTTYTATATGLGGKATATATVTVAAAGQPTVTITASPGTINPGDSSTLTVTATNATSVTISGSDGSSYTLQSSGGTQSVKPSGTTTYTATATGTGGKATAMATVTVASSPTVTITANPTSVAAGASSTLTVTASNASTVTITGSDGTSYNLSATGGTQSVTPLQTTTYTATATGSNGTSAKANVTVTVTTSSAPPTVSIVANPPSITQGNSSTLTVTATNATTVTVSGSDGTSYNLQPSGGTQSVSPSSTTTYTATATGPGGTVSATATVTVVPPGSIKSIDHVIFMLQENRSFDSYFGLLNSYRKANGWTQGADGKTYAVDGLEGPNGSLRNFTNTNDLNQTFPLFKFTSTCIDDMSSAWLESYGAVNRYDFSTTRPILMDGFVHIAEGFANACNAGGGCSGTFTDTAGKRAMGYYDQGFLNYYYYMASQFAVSDRWFSPVSSKSISNRIATFSGGTTQGLVKDPGSDDHLPQLAINTIFQELDQANVSWKIYYTVDQSLCTDPNECSNPGSKLPATDFGAFQYSYQFMHDNPSGASCTPPTQPSSVVGDSSNSFCIDPSHIAPLSQYFTDVANGTLPSFAFIEAGYGNNDEHPGSGQSILTGQAQVAKIINALMTSPSWKDSVFFLSYDEGGDPFDHVPPVPGSSNLNTDPNVVGVPLSNIPDISTIAVNADSYNPCLPPSGTTATTHCDLSSDEPGAKSTDAAAVHGFSAQLGFRVPNMVISPWTRAHYVSHIPMDHTAIIKFVENRFIGSSAHLTARDAAQPSLLDFFDFTGVPWATPPTPPTPVTPSTLGYDPCQPNNMGP